MGHFDPSQMTALNCPSRLGVSIVMLRPAGTLGLLIQEKSTGFIGLFDPNTMNCGI